MTHEPVPRSGHGQPASAGEGLGVLSVSGADAARFLQGQLTQDVARLTPGTVLPAGLQNAQGRVVAVLWLAPGADGYTVLVPAGMAPAVRERLQKYTLRAKVSLTDRSADVALRCSIGADWVALCRRLGLPATPGATHAAAAGREAFALPGGRSVVIAPATDPDLGTGSDDPAWALATVRAGIADIGAAASESYTAHMLNLDRLGAVSFTKGCYTGQEIVARTEHQGRVKRRLLRYEVTAAPRPVVPGAVQPEAVAPGTALYAGDDKVGEIVNVGRDAGTTECLAVIALEARGETLRTADGETCLRPLALPYGLEDAAAGSGTER